MQERQNSKAIMSFLLKVSNLLYKRSAERRIAKVRGINENNMEESLYLNSTNLSYRDNITHVNEVKEMIKVELIGIEPTTS